MFGCSLTDGMVTWDGSHEMVTRDRLHWISHGTVTWYGHMGWTREMVTWDGHMELSHGMGHMGWSYGTFTWDGSHGMVTWD